MAIQTTTSTREALEAERRQLAPAAVNGDADARARIAAIAEELRRQDEEAELAGLAAQEQRRRDAEVAQRRAIERREELLTDAARLNEQRRAGYERIEAATAALLEEIAAVRETGKALDAIATELGKQASYGPPSYLFRGDVLTYIAGALGADDWQLAPMSWAPPMRLVDEADKPTVRRP